MHSISADFLTGKPNKPTTTALFVRLAVRTEYYVVMFLGFIVGPHQIIAIFYPFPKLPFIFLKSTTSRHPKGPSNGAEALSDRVFRVEFREVTHAFQSKTGETEPMSSYYPATIDGWMIFLDFFFSLVDIIIIIIIIIIISLSRLGGDGVLN